MTTPTNDQAALAQAPQPAEPDALAQSAQAPAPLNEHWRLERIDGDQIAIEAEGMAYVVASKLSHEPMEMLLAHMAEELLSAQAPAPAPEALAGSREAEAIAQLRHLVDDLTVEVPDPGHQGLTRRHIAPGKQLMFSNMVHAVAHLLSEAPAPARPAPSVEAVIDEYLAGYEFEGDEGSHTPGDDELFVIKDAIMGLLAEPAFVQALARRAR